MIRDGYQDAVIVGGLDFNLREQVLEGMVNMGALATREELLEYPEDAMRPFDMERGGTVLSDGGAAIVLQSEKFQKLTGDRVYCETAGFA